MVRYRQPDGRDTQPVLDAIDSYLPKIIRRSPKPWVKLIDREAVINHIATAANAYIVDETFLVLYEYGIPWHSGSVWLNETLVLALKPGGEFKQVTDFLELKAQHHNARIAVVGTGLAIVDEALARVYEGLGFTRSIITLTKDIPECAETYSERSPLSGKPMQH